MEYPTTRPDSREATWKIHERYRPLAGPFLSFEKPMLEKLADHLVTTGARILGVLGDQSETLYRLRSECETIDQTAARLRKLSKKR